MKPHNVREVSKAQHLSEPRSPCPGTISSEWALRSRGTSQRPHIGIPTCLLSPQSLCCPRGQASTRPSVLVSDAPEGYPQGGVPTPCSFLRSPTWIGGYTKSETHSRSSGTIPWAGIQQQDGGQFLVRASSCEAAAPLLCEAKRTMSCSPMHQLEVLLPQPAVLFPIGSSVLLQLGYPLLQEDNLGSKTVV